MKNKGIPIKEIMRFIVCYFGIRVQQLKAANAGYKGLDPRVLGIK